MTPDPSMTPFDITNVPTIMWWPSPIMTAGTLIACLLLTLVAIFFLKKMSTGAQSRDSTSSTISLKEKLAKLEAEVTNESLESFLRLVRRILALRLGFRVHSLSGAELTTLAKERGDTALNHLAHIFTSLEEYTFKRSLDGHHQAILEHARALGQALESYAL